MNGGTNEQNNLQSLCPNCHRKKSLHEKQVKPYAKKPTATKPVTKSTATKLATKKTNIQSNNDKMYQSIFGTTREQDSVLRGHVGGTVDWSKMFY